MSGMRIRKVDMKITPAIIKTPIGGWKPKEKKKEKMLTTASAVCRHRLFSRTVFLFLLGIGAKQFKKEKNHFFFFFS